MMQTEPIEKSEIDLMVDWLEQPDEPIPCEGTYDGGQPCEDPATHRMTFVPCGCQSNCCHEHLDATISFFVLAEEPACSDCETALTDIKHHPI